MQYKTRIPVGESVCVRVCVCVCVCVWRLSPTKIEKSVHDAITLPEEAEGWWFLVISIGDVTLPT